MTCIIVNIFAYFSNVAYMIVDGSADSANMLAHGHSVIKYYTKIANSWHRFYGRVVDMKCYILKICLWWGDEAMKNSVLSSLSFNLLRSIHFWTSEIHEDNLCKQQAASPGIVGTKSKKIWMSSAYIWNLISCLWRISPTGTCTWWKNGDLLQSPEARRSWER